MAKKAKNKTEAKSGSLTAMRNYLQEDCGMLQIWAGKTDNDDDYILFLTPDHEQFAVLWSDVGTRIYQVVAHGDVIFLHEKNMRKLKIK